MIPGAHLLDGLIDPADLRQLGIPDDPALLGLFEGYGGLTEGVRAAIGGHLEAYSEIDPSSIRLLEHHYPQVPNLGDVTAADFTPYRGKVSGILGGFPCQDVSHAGLGKGLVHGTRSGLWYEYARAIDEIRPDFVLIENVKGLRSAPAGVKELPEWMTDGEDVSDVELDEGVVGEPDGRGRSVLRALGAVLGDLAELGFHAEWGSLRAAEVGAPHGRERVFIFAWPRRRSVAHA